jgi:hypothetical protein
MLRLCSLTSVYHQYRLADYTVRNRVASGYNLSGRRCPFGNDCASSLAGSADGRRSQFVQANRKALHRELTAIGELPELLEPIARQRINGDQDLAELPCIVDAVEVSERAEDAPPVHQLAQRKTVIVHESDKLEAPISMGGQVTRGRFRQFSGTDYQYALVG